MGRLNHQFNWPQIVDVGGKEIVSHPTALLLSADDTHVNGIFPGQWIKSSTNGYIAIDDGEAAPGYEVLALLDSKGNLVPRQYRTATELNATSMKCIARALGGLRFRIREDALVTPITDAVANSGLYYADLLYVEPTDVTFDAVPYGRPKTGTLLIDSDTVNTTSTNLTVHILGVDNTIDQPAYSATAGAAPRVFLCELTAPGARQP